MEVQLDLNLGDTEAGDLGTLEYNTGSGWVAVPVDGIVSVPAGMTQFDVRIASIDDEVYEGPENFTVDVTGLDPVQGTDTGTATIVDDGTGTLIPIRTTTVQRYLSLTQAQLTKVTPPTSLSL
ncbi:hypothetical protein PWW31_11660 [Vibrio harveyi]|nr:hypothetical protein PWW31_11660 [Vibrio harveyi]